MLATFAAAMLSPHKLCDRIVDQLNPELLARRRAEGWRMVAIEWERDSGSSEPLPVEVPFGLRISTNCRELEEDPDEAEVLRIVMQRVVAESRLADISAELNRRGFRRRARMPWSEADVFRLMPVLVERGPRIFAKKSWTAGR